VKKAPDSSPFETTTACFAMRLAWRRTTKSEVFVVRLALVRMANKTKKWQTKQKNGKHNKKRRKTQIRPAACGPPPRWSLHNVKAVGCRTGAAGSCAFRRLEFISGPLDLGEGEGSRAHAEEARRLDSTTGQQRRSRGS
jgi:hypothetical protein